MECKDCEFYKMKNCKHQCLGLPKGKTCGDCVHFKRCNAIFSSYETRAWCGWAPIRFKEKVKA